MNRIRSFIFFYTGFAAVIFLQSCSSSVETEKKSKYREMNKTSVKNLDLAEREYISSAKINSIEKVSFNLSPEGKPEKSEKLSRQVYDRKGFLIETIIYDDGSKVKYKYTYDYDSNGLKKKTTRHNAAGVLTSYYTYDHNEFGNKEKVSSYNPAGELDEYYIYDYDGDGNLIREEWFSGAGKKNYSIENDYNGESKTRSRTYDENGRLIYEYQFRYDERTNIIEEIKFDERGNKVGLIQYVYKYY